MFLLTKFTPRRALISSIKHLRVCETNVCIFSLFNPLTQVIVFFTLDKSISPLILALGFDEFENEHKMYSDLRKVSAALDRVV